MRVAHNRPDIILVENIGRRVHWKLRKKHGWDEHTPADIVENDEVELSWDLTI